ncbi:DUF6049 family protein [Rhodoluna sp.]|uniref:DUF6049 family protein n=1 Tax=Rhodoluna sp. TaxID=1969481 RepID=UPI0025F3F616|nr:DUF6049 family protein [Rhodoluna sp.]
MKRVLVAALATALLVGSASPAGAVQTTSNKPVTVLQANEPDVPGVFVVPGSKINLVSRESNIPVRIKNEFDAEIRVFVYVSPDNARVITPNAVEVTVPPLTTINAKVPVQAIANGDVVLDVWLTTFSGIQLGKPVQLNMTVNADVEGALLVGFASLIGVLLVLGVIRTLRKKRQMHEVEA